MKSNPDSFSAYLEAKQRARQEGLPYAAAPSSATPLSLLAVLGLHRKSSLPLSELQQASSMNFLEFSQALLRLRDADYLTIDGEPGKETATLTERGMDVAALAR